MRLTEILILITIIVFLHLSVSPALGSTLHDGSPTGPQNTPWGTQLDYGAPTMYEGVFALFDVGFPNFNYQGQAVDIFTGSCTTPPCPPYLADPNAYFNGFIAGQPITFRNMITNKDSSLGGMDNIYYSVSKVIACDEYPCSNTNSACYDLIKYDLNEEQLSICSSRDGKEFDHQRLYFRFPPLNSGPHASCVDLGRRDDLGQLVAEKYCFGLNPLTSMELGVNNGGPYLSASDTTWTFNETGYYQFDLHTLNSDAAHAAGFIKVIPPITGSISGPNLGTVGQALSYTGNGFGTGVNKVELYYSPTSSQSWSLIKSCTATTCTGSWTPTQAGTYYVVVNAYNTNLVAQCSGNPWLPLPTGWQDCGTNDVITVTISNPSMPPVITSLQVNNADANQSGGFTGTYGITGPQVSQQGKNWLNPIKITLNATPGTNLIANYFVAFYNKTAPGSPYPSIIDIPSLMPVASLKSLPASDYFVLRYTSSGKYYVWDPTIPIPNWSEITGLTFGKKICGPAGCNTQLYYTAYPGNTLGNPPNPNLPYSWNITFDRNFGDKNLYTAVEVIDQVSLATNLPDASPVP